MSQPSPNTNRLLAALPEEDYRRLSPYLTTVSLAQRQTLWSPRTPIEAAYFRAGGIMPYVLEQLLAHQTETQR